MAEKISSTQKESDLLGIRSDQIGKYVLLPGDPGRVPFLASFFEGANQVAEKWTHVTFTGTLNGQKVSVVSTGMGCPAMAATLEELIQLGAHTFIRVGTSGMLQKKSDPNYLVITWGAARDEKTSLHYQPLSFPAVADVEVTTALMHAAQMLGIGYEVGISQSKDAFYGEHDPKGMIASKELLMKQRAFRRSGMLCSEMEASALFVVSTVCSVRSGGIMMLGGSTQLGLHRISSVCAQALNILIQSDQNIIEGIRR
ncbi:MAG TPA: uridine phosphorylase [Anaerolineaceae bacterium]|nr:uridine phosphorylase [Anaerolineaceae bacterium]